MVAADPRSSKLLRYLRRIAPTGLPVLIQGEKGTGKELVARHLHRLSGRSGAFVAVNCACLDEDCLAQQFAERRLFGFSEEGCDSDAPARPSGAFLQADGGTLFLENVGCLSDALQAKVLRVLQEQEVFPTGSRNPVRVDLRVISTSTFDLEPAVQAGAFRLDLFYRINAARIPLAPLRERPLDILPLLGHFRRRHAQHRESAGPLFSKAAIKALLGHSWPGNVAELQSVVRDALLKASGAVVEAEHLDLPEARAASELASSLG